VLYQRERHKLTTVIFVALYRARMETLQKLAFDDTATAFSYKSDVELKKAHLIFLLVNHPWMSALATGAAKRSLALGLPVKGIIRSTVFQHFCGGETIAQTDRTIQMLAKFHVGTILDYSVEGEKSEAGFEHTTAEIICTIEKARSRPEVPFSVFKVTGLVHTALLEKVQAGEALSAEEQQAFERGKGRVASICQAAHEADVPVLIDAEESWIQKPIDQMAYAMMRLYNNEKAIVFNTFQMYRADMLNNLRSAFHEAAMHNHYLGVKLVRGAYMEKERARAEARAYSSPIHPDKAATDEAFNKALAFCIDNKQRISLMCGSHNEYSNQFLTVLMDKHGMKPADQRVWFAQLLGMSDNISFNLAKAGYNVAKYVPYGPVEAVMPYLMRRANENTSVAGQSSRELSLIRKELARRRSGS